MSREVQVVAKPHAFRDARIVAAVPQGLTLAQIVETMYDRAQVPAELRTGAVVQVNGEVVPEACWKFVRPKDCASVAVSVAVHGGGGDGKNPLATVLMIAVVVAAAAVSGGALAGALGPGTLAAGSIGASIAGAAITAVGGLLINAIAPPKMPKAPSLSGNSYADSATYSLTGARNRANPFGPVPVVLGKHKVVPLLGARPYTELVGQDEYLRMLFVWGYGPLKVEDIRIGNTPLSQFDGVTIEHREGREGDAPLTLIPGTVEQESVGVELTSAGGWVTRVTDTDTDEISVDVVFPRGLTAFNTDGSRSSRTVELDVQYRPAGTSEWLGGSGDLVFPERTVQAPPAFVSETLWQYGPGGNDGQNGYWVNVQTPVTRQVGVFLDRETGALRTSQTTTPTGNEALLASGTVYGDQIQTLAAQSVSTVVGMGVGFSGLTVTVAAGTLVVPEFRATANTTSAYRLSRRWSVPRGQYEVRLRRITADSNNDRVQDQSNWQYLRSIRDEYPIAFDAPLAVTAVRIKASDQLNGVIDNLSGVVTSYATDWDGTNWTEAASQNPAALFLHTLRGAANARARVETQVDWASLAEWHDFCEANGYRFNMVRDFRSSVWELLSEIASAGRAAPSIIDGKWGVIMDRPGKAVAQHFTPRNSWGFQAQKVLADLPHAWRIRFNNEDREWQEDERIVYDDGYSASNATKFEGLELPGITDPDQVWTFGRYHIATARLRPETYTFQADMEHLVCRRGDLIRVAHDVPMWGGGWGRVVSLTTDGAGNVTGVAVDEQVVMEDGTSYACRFRRSDGSSVVGTVATIAGTTNVVVFSPPIPAAVAPDVGDLAMFGEANRETVELLVRSIEPGENLTAKLTCVDHAPEIYEADQGAIPPFDTRITQSIDVTQFSPPTPEIVSIQSGTSALAVDAGGSIRARILVSLAPGNGNVSVGSYRVRYRQQGAASWSFVTIDAEQRSGYLDNVTEGVAYTIQAQAVSSYGVPGDWTQARTEIVIGQGEPPGDVDGFAVNIVDGNAYLSWQPVTAVDLSHYRIRWSPETSGATWAAAVDLAARVQGTQAQAPAMVGTYLCKAVDHAGNESTTAAAAITTISRVRGLNFVEAVEDATPEWGGTTSGTYYDVARGGLVLSGAGDLFAAVDLYAAGDLYTYGGLVASGGYTLSEIVDLGSVYTVRTSASVGVGGVDLGANLYAAADLYGIANLYGAADGQYSVTLEVRTTDADPALGNWSGWLPFLVGDYTARAFQVRAVLRGTATVTPILERARVVFDMPDRVAGFEATIPAGGGRVMFSPAFYVTPEIGLSVSDGDEGDRYTITNRDATGFDIAFTNGGAGVARQITGIAKAYGEHAA